MLGASLSEKEVANASSLAKSFRSLQSAVAGLARTLGGFISGPLGARVEQLTKLAVNANNLLSTGEQKFEAGKQFVSKELQGFSETKAAGIISKAFETIRPIAEFFSTTPLLNITPIGLASSAQLQGADLVRELLKPRKVTEGADGQFSGGDLGPSLQELIATNKAQTEASMATAALMRQLTRKFAAAAQ